MTDLNPGIKNTVLWLRENGFETSDSGDGKTNTSMASFLPYPHVFMLVEHKKMTSEAIRLYRLLIDAGLDPDETRLDEELGIEVPAWSVQATFDPAVPIPIIALLHVDDAKLGIADPPDAPKQTHLRLVPTQ